MTDDNYDADWDSDDHDDLAEEQPDPLPCPLCGGDGEALGKLGFLTHHRCRQCGATFTEED